LHIFDPETHKFTGAKCYDFECAESDPKKGSKLEEQMNME